MLDSFIKLVIGDLEEKKVYKQFKKRVKALPKEYRYAFEKIEHYMYCVGPTGGDITMFTDMTMFTNLVELFETSAAEGKQVLDVIGNDVGKFCDELMRASMNQKPSGEKLNQEIKEKFNKEVQ